MIQHVRKECSYHYNFLKDIKDYCCAEWTKDKRCIFTQSKIEVTSLKEKEVKPPRCTHFENAVLPVLSLSIQQKYWEVRSEHVTKKEEEKINILKEQVKKTICVKCKKRILSATNNRQKYCEKCKKEVSKKRAKENMRKRRSRESDVNV